MRVTGGELGGRRLRAPRGLATRPTTDRVREAIFDILGEPTDTTGAPVAVLDLFCGSGALAIEALSRGARAAVLVDRAADAVAVTRGNLAALGLLDRAEVLHLPVERALRQLGDQGRRFAWVFVDPPYQDADARRDTLAQLGGGPVPDAGALVLVEHGRKQVPAEASGRLRLLQRRHYGETEISFYRAD